MTEYTASQKRKYLARVLAMNPVHQSGQILAMRNQMLGIRSKDSLQLAAGSKLERLRVKARQQIENIREQMWRLHPQQLADMLNRIDVSQLPELKSAVDRLRVVISNHHHIRGLARHPKQHINLTNTFRRVVMLPPRDSGSVKEAYLRQIVESQDLPKIKSMAAMLKSEYPQLFALESDWLESIQSLRARQSYSSGHAGAKEGYDQSIPWWLIWIAFVILFRIVSAVVRSM